jgi:hypothetical protein
VHSNLHSTQIADITLCSICFFVRSKKIVNGVLLEKERGERMDRQEVR